MKLTCTALLIGAAIAQEDYDGYDELYSDSYDDGLIQDDDSDWKAQNCAMTCGNGNCIMKKQICDAKRDCLDGSDELNCSFDESTAGDHETKMFGGRQNSQHDQNGEDEDSDDPELRPVAPTQLRPQAFRGRFPAMFGPQESTFWQFDQPGFDKFQRRNRRLLMHLTGKEESQTFDQLLKVMFYMTDGKLNLSDYMGYGCHCNVNGVGKGSTVDVIDAACSRNAQCRKCAAADNDFCQLDTPYLVNGALKGRIDGTNCVNRPDTCARSLCECDLEMLRQIIEKANEADSKYQTYNGFDQTGACGSIADLGRSSLANPFGKSKKTNSDEVQCCGVYPNRFPLNGDKGCCGEKSFNPAHSECCASSEVVPIGSC